MYDADGSGHLSASELDEVSNLLGSAKHGTVRVDMFPKKLRATLESLDEGGNGILELEEVTTMVEGYLAMKENERTGTISVDSLPKELRPALHAFDIDGDGTVAPLELARGAEMYQQSKKKVKRLMQVVVALGVCMGIFLAAISGITFAVVELSKETQTSPDGTTLTKGGEGVMKVGTAAFESGMTSLLPNAAFEKLKSFKVRSRLCIVVVCFVRLTQLTPPLSSRIQPTH